MKGIRADPVGRTVRAEPGLKLGEFDRETQAFGLATTLGTVSTTGIAGLTLGAGFGHLMAKYGLALDNVIGADVVTADGRLLTANALRRELRAFDGAEEQIRSDQPFPHEPQRQIDGSGREKRGIGARPGRAALEIVIA